TCEAGVNVGADEKNHKSMSRAVRHCGRAEYTVAAGSAAGTGQTSQGLYRSGLRPTRLGGKGMLCGHSTALRHVWTFGRIARALADFFEKIKVLAVGHLRRRRASDSNRMKAPPGKPPASRMTPLMVSA